MGKDDTLVRVAIGVAIASFLATTGCWQMSGYAPGTMDALHRARAEASASPDGPDPLPRAREMFERLRLDCREREYETARPVARTESPVYFDCRLGGSFVEIAVAVDDADVAVELSEVGNPCQASPTFRGLWNRVGDELRASFGEDRVSLQYPYEADPVEPQMVARARD